MFIYLPNSAPIPSPPLSFSPSLLPFSSERVPPRYPPTLTHQVSARVGARDKNLDHQIWSFFTLPGSQWPPHSSHQPLPSSLTAGLPPDALQVRKIFLAMLPWVIPTYADSG